MRFRITSLEAGWGFIQCGIVMSRRRSKEGYRTTSLAIFWLLALAASLTFRQFEIFLLLAPLSAGIYLLIPNRA